MAAVPRTADAPDGASADDGLHTRLTGIADALGTLLAGYEPDRVTGPDAASLLRLFVRIERMGATGKALSAHRAAAAEVHRAGGHRTTAHWLAEQTGDSVGDAIETERLGEALSAQPAIDGAMRQGRLSRRKAAALAGAVAVDPAAEADLLQRAESQTLREVRDACARVRSRARSAEEEARRHERLRRDRTCRTWTDADTGAFHLAATLAPDDGARVLAALEAASDAVFLAARSAGTRDSLDNRRADALVALATGDHHRSGRRSGASVHVRVDLDALRQGFAGSGQVCEIPGVGPVPVQVAREVMGDALTSIVITDGTDVTTVCRLTRHIPAAVASALLERDPTCVVPGCDRADHLEVDHWQVDFARGGPTAWWNLAHLCPHHHRLKTTGRFRLTGGPGRWRFTPAAGPPDDEPGQPELALSG